MQVDAQLFGLDRTGGTLVVLHYLKQAMARGDRVHLTTLGTPGDRRFVQPPGPASTTYVGLRRPLYRGLARIIPGGLGFPAWELRRLRRAAKPADVRLATYTFTVLSSLDLDAPVHHHAQHLETLLEPTERRRSLVIEGLRADVYRTANCTWVAEQIESVGGRVDGIVTPGIDLSVFTAVGRLPRRGPEAGRARPARVITLGKAIPWKGLVDVVAAVGEVARKRPVELITYGSDRPSVPSHVVHHHMGFIDASRLAELYRSADVCVLGSWYESFPLPPLEAMACGTPVVCTRLGTEDYAIHEKNCLIVQPRDRVGIAAAIAQVLNDGDLREELVREGNVTAAQHGWPAAEEAFLRHLDSAAGRQAT